MKKATLIFVGMALTTLLLSSCGNKHSKKTANNIKKQESKPKVEMTIEKSAKLENELASLLMDKYWSNFKGKEYNEVKDLYNKYNKEKDEIYQKYGVIKHTSFDQQKYTYWTRDHREELKQFRKSHPEYDFYSKYPEFGDANIQLYHYAQAQLKTILH